MGIGIAVATLVALAFSLGDRTERIHQLMCDLLRYFLAFVFVKYGMAKIIGMQFAVTYSALDSRVVDLSSMRLAWTFFGHTYGYQAMIGVSQIAAATFLCFRRTATLGACLLLTVITNIVMVNFFYDVCVKLHSVAYLVMTVHVLLRDRARLWALFATRETPSPPEYSPVLPARWRGSRWMRRAGAVWIAFVLGYPAYDTVRVADKYDLFTPHPLRGAWRVETCSGVAGLLPTAKDTDQAARDANGDPVAKDGAQAPTVPTWEKIYFERGPWGFIRAGGKLYSFEAQVDHDKGSIEMRNFRDDPELVLRGEYAREGNSLRVRGAAGDRPFSVGLTRITEFDRDEQ